MRQWFACSVSVLAIALLGARPAPEEQTHVVFVPWKVLRPGTAPPRSPLMLFWIPASRQELRRSELLTSEELARYAAQCVAMVVVQPDDHVMIQSLRVDGRFPMVLLADGDGAVLAHLERESGELSAAEVEAMVRTAMDARAAQFDAVLDDAKEKAASGDTEAALVLYRKVLEQRCTCPRQGKDAQRALRKLASR
ncbi:MAG: hypothetical protein QOH21_1164 [Acidobacteriota bacterium]|jgi:hypothetical protein|nr:hypothetical protein [Acidobacteriota bacterium]